MCNYCEGNISKFGSGLDRKDSNKGYLLSNVVSCCVVCNMAKNGFFNYEEFLLFKPILNKIRIEQGGIWQYNRNGPWAKGIT